MSGAQIVLGARYCDEISGFEGTATARTEYLAGYVSVLLVRGDTAHKPEELWFAENRLVSIEPAKAKAGFGS